MIDSHLHFWQYSADDFPWIQGHLAPIAKDMLPKDLCPQLTDNIDGIIAVQARPCAAENDYLNDLAQQHELIKGIVGWFDFEQDADKQLEVFKRNPKMKGFRHMLQDEKNPSEYMNHHKGFNTGVEKIQQAELLYGVLIHQKDLDAAVQFCQRHDRYELVVDHLAKPQMYSKAGFECWIKMMQRLVPLKHVNLKISGLVTEGGPNCKAEDFQAHLDKALELFGPERLVWGSDWPVSYATHSYTQLMDFWQQWSRQWSDSERLQVESGTAQRLYKL